MLFSFGLTFNLRKGFILNLEYKRNILCHSYKPSDSSLYLISTSSSMSLMLDVFNVRRVVIIFP